MHRNAINLFRKTLTTIMGHRAEKVNHKSGERNTNEKIYKPFAGIVHGIWNEYVGVR